MSISRKSFLHKCASCLIGYSFLRHLKQPHELYASTDLHKADYWKLLPNKITQCQLCPNKCELSPGDDGLCHARGNRNGKLYSLVYGRPSVIAMDFIEKTPLFHYQIKGKAFSIATAGCNLSCLFCQNWEYSQNGPDKVERTFNLTPEQVIKRAKKHHMRAINFFYTEPTIYYEYMRDIAILAKREDMKTFCITAGYINKEPLQKLIPLIDAFVVGLKGFDNRFYKRYIGVELEPVKETLKIISKSRKSWFEIVNLIIPKLNDSSYSINRMTKWISSQVGKNVPLHFTKFEPYYKLKHIPPTPVSTLKRAYRIAKRNGLKFVYIGNVPGIKAGNTYCPKCGKEVIERLQFKSIKNRLKNGKCPCGYKLPGHWY